MNRRPFPLRQVLLACAFVGIVGVAFTAGRLTAPDNPRDAVLFAPDGTGLYVVELYDRHGYLLTASRVHGDTTLTQAWPLTDEPCLPGWKTTPGQTGCEAD